MIDLTKFNKEERKRLANSWYSRLDTEYLCESSKATMSTCVMSESELFAKRDVTDTTWFKRSVNIFIIPTDSVSMLFRHNEVHKDMPTAILNFASYKHPGGMFFNGSGAQEEALCHHSVLIKALNEMKDCFYRNHIKLDHHGLYGNDLIFSEYVTFMDRVVNPDMTESVLGTTEATVITAAAPNLRAYSRNSVDYAEDAAYDNALEWRIRSVLQAALITDKYDYILGAFGCGVFRNDPYKVASKFFKLLTDGYANSFNNVYFPIPRSFHNNNYEAFCEVGQSYKDAFDGEIIILEDLEDYDG